MSKRRILKKGKKKNITKNLGLVRGGSWGGGRIKKINNSWAQGVKPKAATKLALKSSTSLTRPASPAFRAAVKTSQQPNMRKGIAMLKKKAPAIPKNVQPSRKVKRYSPKR